MSFYRRYFSRCKFSSILIAFFENVHEKSEDDDGRSPRPRDNDEELNDDDDDRSPRPRDLVVHLANAQRCDYCQAKP